MPTKARTKRQAVRPNQGKPIPGWMWLGAGLVLGLGAATGLMLSGTLSNPENASLPKPNPVAQPKISPEAPIEREAPPVALIYDFYSKLENKEIEQPRPGIVNREKPLSPTKPQSLQIGSFRRQEDAENMKAELAFLGLIATIEIAKIDSDTWHRVKIGPFESARDMDKVLRKLRANGREPLLTSAAPK